MPAKNWHQGNHVPILTLSNPREFSITILLILTNVMAWFCITLLNTRIIVIYLSFINLISAWIGIHNTAK